MAKYLYKNKGVKTYNLGDGTTVYAQTNKVIELNKSFFTPEITSDIKKKILTEVIEENTQENIQQDEE